MNNSTEVMNKNTEVMKNITGVMDTMTGDMDNISYPEDFQNVSCTGATNLELKQFEKIAFVLESIIQPIFGIIGFVVNTAAVPLLYR